MSNIISLLRGLFVFCVVIVSVSAARSLVAQDIDFEVCNIKKCQKPTHSRSCKIKILFFETEDPACIAKKNALNAQYATQYQACLKENRLRAVECDVLRSKRTQAVERSPTLTTATTLSADGASCRTSTECHSGYCLPGPIAQTTESESSYCVAASQRCAFPERSGAAFGDIAEFDGQLLLCDDSHRGKWARFSTYTATDTTLALSQLRGLHRQQQKNIDRGWFVIVASHRFELDAEKHSQKFSSRGYLTRVFPPFGKNQYFGVMLASFVSKDEAEQILNFAVERGFPKDSFLWQLR